MTDDVPIPPCSVYLEELKHCKKISSKIQRYYANQPSTDCSSWKQIYDVCVQWENKRDQLSKQAVVEFEQTRQQQIINNRTNVWEYRKTPPADWVTPGKILAEKMKEYEKKMTEADNSEQP